ncbi:hypothetical protein HNR46_003791 [Haloferula luteola]|uniref:Uncharacterized protein n=1 Tax=Haloferula luteola TaxID=595692 RepID=A0A840VI67_9BACT|nr:hypothetical protein [Haloferula luteola]MBB5353530.1 hypothetical protein [Haloferula luteola]
MSTKPDDETLALWIEDELDEVQSREIDAWAKTEPEWWAHREAARESKAWFAKASPLIQDAPYGEFFNARILREIQQEAGVSSPATVAPAPSVRRPIHWLVPATAAAGIALGFWAGRGSSPTPDLPAPPMAALTPVIYTPESGVDAEWVAVENATVIILDGVSAIPDSWELPETAVRDQPLLPIAHAP